jgi:small subunit ribosomal protein S21
MDRDANFGYSPARISIVAWAMTALRRAQALPSQVSRQGLGLTVVTAQLVRQGQDVQVLVRDNNVDQALRALKKKLQREGVFREMKLRDHYEKPSEKRAREKAEAVRRARKVARKRAQRDGLLPVKAKPVR